MADPKFKESAYKFVNPVRYFKANDPYYFEVDNIPLKQLQENILWVKDQIGVISVGNVTRDDILELKPFVDGKSQKVFVKPGRYIGRVNDAYKVQDAKAGGRAFISLQPWETVNGANPVGEQVKYKVYLMGIGNVNTTGNKPYTSEVQEQMEGFRDGLGRFEGMTGLVERAFGNPVIEAFKVMQKDGERPKLEVKSTGPVTDITKDWKTQIIPNTFPRPLNNVLLWSLQRKATSLGGEYHTYDPLYTATKTGFARLNVLENFFIKRWKGIFRTSVVDVPEEISIPIPKFDPDDFFYWEHDTGTAKKKIHIPSDLRIDLLFLYTKSIDVSSTTTSKWVGSKPSKITTPELGIVKGAGLGIDFACMHDKRKGCDDLHTTDYEALNEGVDADGNVKILPNVNDQIAGSHGFTKQEIYGSFPSPDDLLNLAPTLMEDIEWDEPALIGQSVLPLAYVVVRRDPTVVNKEAIIAEADLIDIRPFFRTTELTYNERSGVANAHPPLSLVNPAVGSIQLYKELSYIKNKLEAGGGGGGEGGSNNSPRTVATGYVFGGVNWGVEGALMDWQSTVKKTDDKQKFHSYFGLPAFNNTSLLSIPDIPDWDLPRWAQLVTGGGSEPNDYINTLAVDSNQAEIATFGCYKDSTLSTGTRLEFLGTENEAEKEGRVNVHFVRKRIVFEGELPSWMQDYYVDVQYWNCFGLTSRQLMDHQRGAAGAGGIWVEKQVDGFTIYVGWTANDHYQRGNEKNKLTGSKTPAENRTNGSAYAGFGVVTEEISNRRPTRKGTGTTFVEGGSDKYSGEGAYGACIYPTVMFEVVGIPKDYEGYALGMPQGNKLKLV